MLTFEGVGGWPHCSFAIKKCIRFFWFDTLATAVAFVILFSAPGNEIRVASEIANWMPEYETMPFGSSTVFHHDTLVYTVIVCK